MSGRGLFAVCLLLAPVAILMAACGGGGSGKATPGASPTTTAEAPTLTPPSSETATPSSGIRQLDPTREPGLRDFLAGSGGQVEPSRITYADLTDDGNEEAVVPVSSGGEGGDKALFVFGQEGAELRELLRVVADSSLTAQVTNGRLAVTEPVFAPGDAMCCPSQLRKTTYRWDGSQLVVADQKTQPAGGN